jgi:hypothetical protein
MMVRGRNGKVISFSHKTNEFGVRDCKQATMNRKYKNQRFILDTRTTSIRAYHYRKMALQMEGASSFKMVLAPFRNNKSQKFRSFKGPQLEL